MNSYNYSARLYRTIPPANPHFTTLDGRKIDGSAGYADVAAADAWQLGANGWTILMEIGPTTSRPKPGVPSYPDGLSVTLTAGQPFFDTTIGAAIYWNPATSSWVNASGASV